MQNWKHCGVKECDFCKRLLDCSGGCESIPFKRRYYYTVFDEKNRV